MMPARAIAAIGVALLLGACSAKEATPQETTPPATHGSLAECLKDHGVPDSGGPAAVLGPPAGVDPGAWDAAMKACATFAPGPAGP